MDDILSVTNLVKRYGSLTAVDGISFSVPAGSLFAFLGPNGAGKSSTIHCICTLQGFDSGSITLAGHQAGREDDAIRRAIGVVFQDSVLDSLLTVRENLSARAAMYGITGKAFQTRLANVSDVVDLGEFMDRRYGKLSGGQKRRADIARGLIHTPQMLFLDEPTTGLDPQTRTRVWECIRTLQKDTGVTVFLTTHYMDEAARADMVAVIDHGKLIAQDTPLRLKAQYGQHKLRLIPIDGSARNAMEQYLSNRGLTYRPHTEYVTVNLANTIDAVDIVNDVRPMLSEFELMRGSMDDVFLALTGHEIREGSGVA